MKVPREDAVRTQKRLLAVASEAFAEKGYREATVSEICERAQSNVAAVNYHFGDKETLYAKAWRHAFYESLKVHPPDGGVSADAPPEERLRGRVKALLRRVTGANNKEFLIVLRELASPTGLLDEVTRKDLRPLREKMEGIIRELLGPACFQNPGSVLRNRHRKPMRYSDAHEKDGPGETRRQNRLFWNRRY